MISTAQLQRESVVSESLSDALSLLSNLIESAGSADATQKSLASGAEARGILPASGEQTMLLPYNHAVARNTHMRNDIRKNFMKRP